MSRGFEKNACKEVEKALKAKVFVKSTPKNFQDLGETAMTSLLICNFMKTFDNPDIRDFLKATKSFCDFKKLTCKCHQCRPAPNWYGLEEEESTVGNYQIGTIRLHEEFFVIHFSQV